MARLRVAPVALDEIRSIVDHIATDNPTAAERWYRKLDRAFHLLAEFPLTGEVFKVRKRLLRRRAFGNYVIYYRPLNHGVEIAHVVHGARDFERFL